MGSFLKVYYGDFYKPVYYYDRRPIMKPESSIQFTEMQENDSEALAGQFVVFTLDKNYFALPVKIVNRIVRSIMITKVPGLHENIIGVINVHGKVVPVFNIRKIFNLPPRDIQLSDLFIIVRTSRQTISFVVDAVKGITDRVDQKIVPAEKIFPGMENIFEGLIFFEDGMILIYDMNRFFTLEKAEKIDIGLIGQKMKEIKEPGKKIRKRNTGQDNITLKGEEAKTQAGKSSKKAVKQKKIKKRRSKTSRTNRIK